MRENQEMIVIDDFSPGIYSDFHHAGAGTPSDTEGGEIKLGSNGAAVVDGTFRCCADRAGALIPLPKLIAGRTSEALPTASNADAKYLQGVKTSYLLDGVVRGEMYIEGENNAVDPDRAGVFTMYGMAYKVDGDSHFQWTVQAQFHKPFVDGTTKHDLMWARSSDSMDVLSPSQIGSGNFISFKGRVLLDSPAYEAIAWVAFAPPGYVTNYQGAQWKTGTIPAAELSLTDFDLYTGTTYPGKYGRVIGIYPDPGWDTELLRSGFLDDTYSTLYGGIEGVTMQGVCWLVGHQGRIIGISRVASGFGVPSGLTQYRVIGESIHYSPVQDFYAELGFGCYELALFGEEKPDRTGAVASITADEIIFIKDRGGAVMVRGDLDNPTVVQLPYVESTHGARSIPVATPLGLVYGTREGVYLWEGGDSSKHLSPQIDGWFWNHDPALVYLAQRGRFGWWNPFVCVPNNFILDTRNQSWWRLDSTSHTGVSINAYDVSNETNRLYAFPHKLSAANATMWWNATPDVLADTYSWKSMPIHQSRLRVVKVQELRLAVAGGSITPATVTVTLTGHDPDGRALTPVAVEFTTTGNRYTQFIHKAVSPNFQGLNIQVQIEANSNDTDEAAPKVMALGIVIADRAGVKNKNG